VLSYEQTLSRDLWLHFAPRKSLLYYRRRETHHLKCLSISVRDRGGELHRLSSAGRRPIFRIIQIRGGRIPEFPLAERGDRRTAESRGSSGSRG